jgi:hypothetical protein
LIRRFFALTTGAVSPKIVATGHNLIHLQRLHRGPLTRPVVSFDTSPLGSHAASTAVRGAGVARAVPGQPVPRQKVGAAGQGFGR